MNFPTRFSTTLASGYTSGGGSLALTSASGLPSGACDFYLIVRAEGANTEEVFHVTNISGTTATAVGAKDGTSASNHGSGAVVIAGVITSEVLTGLAAGAGALILLETQTASSSSELDFTASISASYDTYVIELVDLVTVNVNATVVVEVSTDGGSTYDQTSGDYNWATNAVDNSSGSTNFSTATNLRIVESSGNPGRVSGSAKFYAPAGSSAVKSFIGQTTGSGIGWNIWGKYTQASAFNAFRLRTPSGNFTSGVARCYGIAK